MLDSEEAFKIKKGSNSFQGFVYVVSYSHLKSLDGNEIN